MEAISPYSYAGLPIKKSRPIGIKDIESVVSQYFDIPIEKIKSKSRIHHIAIARHFAIYFIRKHTNLSLKTIATNFWEGMDHSTVLYSYNYIRGCKDYDPYIKEAYPVLDEMIRSIKTALY